MMSAAAPSEHGGVSATSLQLRLLRSHGVVKNGVMAVNPGGAGMAQALELGGERLNDVQWTANNRCRISWQSVRWQLLNECPSLVCAINGHRVPAKVAIPVFPGDRLEIGLLRYLIEAGEVAAPAPVAVLPTDWLPPVVPYVSDASRINEENLPEIDAFDLRDLASPVLARIASLDPANAPLPHLNAVFGLLDEPFAVLDIDGAKRALGGEPLADLLAGRPVRPAMSPELAQPTLDPADQKMSAREHVEFMQWPAHEDVVVDENRQRHDESSNGSAVTRLFADLNAEFERVVRDPSHLNGRADWDELNSREDIQANVTIDDLRMQATPFPQLLDILLPREAIDSVLAGFTPLLPGTLMAPPEREDVLHLFAPQLSRGARSALPGLTQREHHDMSPDSYMNPGVRNKSEADGDSSFASTRDTTR